MKVEVYKETTEDWKASYQLKGSYQKLVRVSLLKEISSTEGVTFKVCVWGNGDMGMLRILKDLDEAVTTFRAITGLSQVTFGELIKLGLRFNPD